MTRVASLAEIKCIQVKELLFCLTGALVQNVLGNNIILGIGHMSCVHFFIALSPTWPFLYRCLYLNMSWVWAKYRMYILYCIVNIKGDGGGVKRGKKHVK